MANQRYRVEPPLAKRQRLVQLKVFDSNERDWVSLGRLAEAGPTKEVRMDLSREHILSIVGKRGSGKSFTLGWFEGLCTTERSTSISNIGKDRAALLFDTLNIFQWMTAPVAGGLHAGLRPQSRRGCSRGGSWSPLTWTLTCGCQPATRTASPVGRSHSGIRTQDMEVDDELCSSAWTRFGTPWASC